MRAASPLAPLVATALVAGSLVVPATARAQAEPAPSPKIANADRLFAEGKALLDTNLLQACDKFDESLRENPAAIGTLLNVALCDEKLGRVASAVAKFSEARDRAAERGLPEHVRAAEEHIAQLTPTVPHLAIKLTRPATDTVVLVDDRVVPPDKLHDITVDPGERVIVVSAPARVSYRTTLLIHRADRQDLVIPALVPATVTSSTRRIGQIATFVGVGAAGTGLGIGIYARHLYRSQFGDHAAGDGRCDDMKRCEPRGQAKTQRARTLGNVGTVVGVVGVAVAGVGAYFWLRSPGVPGAEAPIAVVPAVDPDSLGVAAVGRF